MITLLTGGSSAEREVSLATAETIGNSLMRLNIAFTNIDVSEVDWLDVLKSMRPVVAIIAVHGTFGEDGTLQRILEENNITHTGSTADVASLTFNKRQTKKALKAIGIPMANDYTLPLVPFTPVVVKPNAQGSSIGVSIVRKVSELDPAITMASQYGSDYILEEFLDGKEMSCAVTSVYGTVCALPVVEICPKTAFFDYEAKYTVGMSEEICPAELSEFLTRTIQLCSERIFTFLKIRQYC